MNDTVTISDGIRRIPRGGGLCPRCGELIRKLRADKRCPSCGLTRPAEDWSHNPSRSDHLDSRCRACIRNIGHLEAHDNRMPENPVEVGAVLGSLREHVPPSYTRGGASTPAILRLDDATVVNFWTGEREKRDEVMVYDRKKKSFYYRRGERVVLALGGGLLGKVRFTYTGRTRTTWEDEYPDMRLSLVDLFHRWYPSWSAPADLPSWPTYAPDDGYKVMCSVAAHTDRNARITAHGELHCSRHTGSGYWNAVDVLMRRFGFDEDAAVAELSRIEDENLAVLAAEVWGALAAKGS